MITDIDHVQYAMPPGGEDKAREFYIEILGMSEVLKPYLLSARGGVWFEAGSAWLHLGVEENFRPSKKAHAAFRIAANGLREKLSTAGYPIVDASQPDTARFYSEDCFGNRIEFIPDRDLTG